ncbi:histamine H3 receptor-like [Antedon mediterranea]|uniref:histamine H3 receptor-like n=1 Tax=Antedon mediterranea TaxID=105859 RepID=UPI003AF685D2
MDFLSDYYVRNQTDDTLVVSGGIVICWILCVVTVFGNSLVILAFITEKSLRSNPANLFILNLSGADFLTGAFSFPLFTLWLMFGTWPFGEGVCKMWLIVNYTACGISVCAIIFISLDRYWMLKMKLKYRQFQTTKRVTVMIIVSWVFILPLNIILIVFWEKFSGEHVIDYSIICDTGYYNNLTNVFVQFIIPLAAIIFLNCAVYNEIRHRTRTNPSVNSNRSIVQATSNRLSVTAASSVSTRRNVNTTISSTGRHRKAAFTLTILVSVFAVCWTPHNIVLIWRVVSEDLTDYTVWQVVTYLLWSNSAINPFLYALTNLKIREVFYKFFGLKCFK